MLETRVSWCLLPGLVAALVMLAAHKLDRLEEPLIPMGIAVGAGLLAGLLWGLLKPISLLDAALIADRQLGLKERLSNAVIFAETPEASPLIPALISDAGRHASDIVPRDVLPYRAPKPMLWSAGILIAIGALWFAPQYALFRTEEEVAVRHEMREQGKELRVIAKRVKEEAGAKNLVAPEQLAAKLEELAAELEKAKLTKKQALLKSGKLAAEVREAQKMAALAAGASAMGRASEALEGVSLSTPQAQEMAKAIHERKAADLAAKLSKLSQDLKNGKFKSKEEQQALAEDLKRMADALGEAGLNDAADAAQSAAQSLEQGDTDGAASALQDGAQNAADAAQQAAANESLEELADALQQSQSDVAQADQEACATHGQPQNCPPGGG